MFLLKYYSIVLYEKVSDVNKMEKVHILLSTYNGEKYIEEQLKSLFLQEYNNFKIIVRDDGSTDRTVDIIHRYQTSYPDKIELYEGKNVGWKKSFQWLILNAGNADYYSFCDQDDIWGKKKLKHAVSELEKVENGTPAIYLSDFAWCDEEMNRKKRNAAYLKKHSLIKFITLGDRNELGFTEMFNKAALEGIRDKKCLSGGCPHDEVVYLYCLLKGKVIWGKYIDAEYRRHGDNASAQDLKGGNHFTHFLWRIKYFIFENHKNEMYERFLEFYKDFKNEMTEEQKNIFRLYLGNQGKIKKAFKRCRYRDTLLDELSMRILLLVGKV